MAFLIDTDIIIYSVKQNSTVQEHFRKNATLPKAISVITYSELLYGAKKSEKKERNLAVIHRIAEIFPIIDITRSIVESFSDLKSSLEESGSIIPDLDLLIASTALSLNYTLVTNNIRHFQRINGLKIENWAE